MSVDFKAFRKANNLTQGELAAFLQCTQGFISQMEHGISPVPSDVIRKILAAGKWNTSDLEDDRGDLIRANDGLIDQNSEDMEINQLLAAVLQHGEDLRALNEEFRKQGQRLDRILALTTPATAAVFAPSSQETERNSPPRTLDRRVNEL